MHVNRHILVTGAGGFIGKYIVESLLSEGWLVKAMVRKPGNISPNNHENLKVVYADMCDSISLDKAMQGCSVVVHLAARMSDEKDSVDVNVEGARRLIEGCRKIGCERIINMSSQSAKIAIKGLYAQTKWEADQLFQYSGLMVTTLMPSIVYGKELSGVFGTIVHFAQKLPVIPILGSGKWISAPIWVEDVSEAIISCINNRNTVKKSYDLGGPDLISFDYLIDKICAEIGMQRIKMHIPYAVSLAMAKIMDKIMSRPVFTISNVLGSNQDTKIDISKARQDFGFDPLSLDVGLKTIFSQNYKVFKYD